MVVLPRSHLRHNEITADQPPVANGGVDFCQLRAEDPRLDGLGPARLICARAGDLLLWDSRTVHATEPARSTAPLPREADGRPKPARLACYVCLVPAEEAIAHDHSLAARRSHSVEHWLTCTHWPVDNRMASEGRQPADPRWLSRLPEGCSALVFGLPRCDPEHEV